MAVESATTPRDLSSLLTETLENQEKKIIVAALAESNGKVAAPTGAATRLGIPRSTLDRKILRLNIKQTQISTPVLT